MATTKIARAVLELVTDASVHLREIEKAKKANKGLAADLTKIGQGMQDLGGTLTKSVSLPIVAMGAFAVKAFSDFDSSMTKSLSIMGDVSDEMRGEMSDAAREVGRTTTFSAAQSAEAFYFLASAGLDAGASIAAMPKVAAFATAGNFDLAKATELLADSQSALGLTIKDDAVANMENMVRVSDVLVTSANMANASTQQFAEALTTKAAASMKSLNMDLEEGVAVLAVFADQGIKGSQAGTTFNATIRGLTNGVQNQSAAFKEMGIEVYNADGAMNNMADIIGQMETAVGDLSVEEKRAALTKLGFTEETLAGTLALLGNSEAIRKYEANLRSAGGSTEKVATKQMQSFSAQMTILWNNINDVGIEIGAALVPHIARLAKFVKDDALPVVKDLVAWFKDLPKPVQDSALAFSVFLALAGPGLVAAGFAIKGAGTALAFMGVGGTAAGVGVTAADSALKRFILTLAKSPITLTLISLGTGFMIAKGDMDAFHAAIERQDAILKDPSLRLTEYGKSLWQVGTEAKAGADGVIDFSFATNGLSVSIEGLADRAAKSGFKTRAELQKTAAQAMALYEQMKASGEYSAEELARAFAVAQAATKAAGGAVRQLTDEQKKYNEQIQQTAAIYTGAKLKTEVRDLANVLLAAGGAGALSVRAFADLAGEAFKLKQAGATLTPELAGMIQTLDDAKPVNQAYAAWLKTVVFDWRQAGMVLPGVTAKVDDFHDSLAPRIDETWRNQRQFLPLDKVRTEIDLITGEIRTVGGKAGSAFAATFAESISGLGDIVVGAIQGGGNVAGSVGAHIGKGYGMALHDSLLRIGTDKEVTNKFGKLAAGFLGPVGAMAGGMIAGKLASAIGNIGKNNTKAGREEAAKLLGFPTVAALYAHLETMGAEGAALAHAGLNTIGKKDTAANNAWIASVEALFKKTEEATAALANMRGELANLQAQSTPTWQQMQQAAEFLGIEINALGPAFQQQRLTEQATEIWNAWDTLRLSGEDLSNHIGAMSGKLNEFVSESLTAGTKIPENFRVMLQQMADAGLLLDENGERMDDLSRIQFGEAVKSEWEIVGEAISKLEAAIDRLVKQLEGPVVKAVEGVAGAFRGLPASMNFDARPNYGDEGDGGLRGFSAGTPGLDFLNFGKQRRVNLHGNEAVIPQGGGHELAGEIAAGLMSHSGASASGGGRMNRTPLVIQADGRELARVTVQHMGEQLALAGY